MDKVSDFYPGHRFLKEKEMKLKTLFKVTLSLLLMNSIVFGQDRPNSDGTWTLEECINYAWDHNLTVRNSELSQLGNEINLKQSQWALAPNLNAGGSLGKSFGRTIDPVTNRFVSQDFLSGGISANANVTLYQGGMMRNTIKQNKVNLEASEYDLQKSKNDIALNVATNYLNVLLNREQLSNAEFQLQVTKEQLERTKKLVDAGSLPLSNALDLESQVASNEVAVVNAENNLSISLLNLKQSMQMPANETLSIEVPELEVENISISITDSDEIFAVALTTQPEVKSAELGIESSDLGVKISKSGYLPTLSVGGSLSTNYSDQAINITGLQEIDVPPAPIGFVEGSNATVFSNPSTRTVPITSENYAWGEQFEDNLGQSVRVNLNVPIFNRLATKSSVQRAEIQKQRAEIQAENTRNTLRQNVETAHTNAVASFKSYEASLKRVAALEETFRATEQRYNVGTAHFTDYQVASNNLFAARADLTQSKYSFIFRVKILDFYLGNPITLD
jgi:outer membrane protein